MTDKIKPCPFCGGEADAEWHHGYWGVRCNNCNAEVIADGMNDAIELWNTRKPMDSIVEQLKERTFSAECYNDNFDGIQINNLLCLGDVIEIVEGVQNE